MAKQVNFRNKTHDQVWDEVAAEMMLNEVEHASLIKGEKIADFFEREQELLEDVRKARC